MDVLAPISRWIVAPAWAWWERSPYLRHYRSLRRTQFDAPDIVQARQRKRVAEIVRHAYSKTVFWKRRIDEAGLNPASIQSLSDLRALPLLTKSDLRRSQSEMLAAGFVPADLHRKKTSGSTGVSVEVLVHDSAQQFKRSCTLRSDEWSGWRLGERIGAVWGNPDHLKHGWRGRLRNALLHRHTCLDTLNMDDAAMRRFATALRQRPPSLIFGHAHSIYLLARFLESADTPDIQPRGIISTAMVLHDFERRTIEEAFQCKVTNRYGCEEVGLIACECERHHGLHINCDGIYLEVLRPDLSPCAIGEPGMIVVTDLVNRAMPIIRYQVGDMGVLSDRRCPCGRGLTLLETVEGRVADYVVTPGGGMISGISLTENFAVLVPGVEQMQIIQEALDSFLFRMVKGPGFAPRSLETLATLVAERIGPTVQFECEFVDRILPESSGKYRFCISKVPTPYATSHSAEACIRA